MVQVRFESRILYVIDSMGRGGAETQLLKTLARLPADKFEAFIVLSREPGASYEQLAALPIVQEIIVLASRFESIAKSVKPAIIKS